MNHISYMLEVSQIPQVNCHRESHQISPWLITTNMSAKMLMGSIWSGDQQSHFLHQPQTNKLLYMSLVGPSYPIAVRQHPHQIKHIEHLENVQRRITKYILNYQSLGYKDRCSKLNLLPLMYWLELHDLLFLIICIQSPADNVTISESLSFVSYITRSSSSCKLKYKHRRTTATRNFYYNRVVRL